MLHEAPADRAAACADPGLLRTLAQCTGDDDNDLREAALRCVGELAADAGCLRAMQQASIRMANGGGGRGGGAQTGPRRPHTLPPAARSMELA